jgi:hypothetical protein
MSQEQFIDRCHHIHGNKYDYANALYVNAHTPVQIRCKQCGCVFLKSPTNHFCGQGCPECAFRKIGRDWKVSADQFIQKSRQVHGEKYDYSKTRYKTSDDKVTITCRVHGDFEQVAYHHLAGHGCVRCRFNDVQYIMTDKRHQALEKARNAKVGQIPYNKHTTQNFIDAAKSVHGSRYDYSKVVYESSHEKVTIVCHTHGEFTQSPDAHKRGVGCPRCSVSKGEASVAKCLDSLGIFYEQEKKFPECKDKRPLQFDFYFLHQGIQFLVEYHGIQHSKPIPFFESKLKHEWYVKHDQMKREFAKSFGFILIEIWHTQSDIASFLTSEINKHTSAPSRCNYAMQLRLID